MRLSELATVSNFECLKPTYVGVTADSVSSIAFLLSVGFQRAFLGIIVLGGLIYRADLTGITVMSPKKFIEPSFCILYF